MYPGNQTPTMENTNKSGKRRRKRRKKWKPRSAPPFRAADISISRQGLPMLHMACLYGQLAVIQRLIESNQESVNSSDFEGRRPLHVVLSSQSSPNTSLCLRYLLEQGADVNSKTDSGRTPLHVAAAEGLLECVEILVQAGADVMALDNMGHTPLILACVWCHRNVGRYLRNRMWHEDKKREMQERLAQNKCVLNLVKLKDVDKNVSQLPEDGGVDKQKQLSCSEGVLADAELVGENSEQAVCMP